MTLKEITKNRRTVKNYDKTKDIPQNVWDEIVDFGLNSPTSMNWQTWRALVIDRNSDLHKKLGEDILIFNTERALFASKIVVFITPTEDRLRNTNFSFDRELNNLKLAAAWKGEEFKKENFPDDVIRGRVDRAINSLATSPTAWAARQAYIGSAYMTVAAAYQGVDTTYMEGFVAPKMKELLLKEGYIEENEQPTLIVVFGYKDDNYPMKPTNRDPKDVKFVNAK